MADPTTTGFTLAGFLLAKALSVLTGEPCAETLVPVGFVEKNDGQRALYLFPDETQEAAVHKGVSAMAAASLESRATALVHDGYANDRGVRTDAFVVRIWVDGAEEPNYLIQRWKRQAENCESAVLTRIDETQVLIAGIPASLSRQQQEALTAGINLNDEVARIWQSAAP